MSSNSNSGCKIIESIRDARKKIWEKEPADVKRLLETKGSFQQNCMAVLYAESETRQLVDFLYCIRSAAKKGEVTLESVKAVTCATLELYAAKFEGWYHITDTVHLLKNARSAASQVIDKAEFNTLIEELLLYIGRLNFWIEVKIPWYEIIGTYEWVVHGIP